ncbi:MAG: Gfo/Idh/MocA family oxidoreductase [Polyangiaceae bacterium]|jgi:predicted dehydrogenase
MKETYEGNRRIRYAVIGLGNIAQVAILPAFEHAKQNSELVALISSNREKLTVLAKKYEIEHTGSYDSVESVLRTSRADAVYIALPNTMHRSMTERVAAVGVHVLCEKPMAMTVEDCEAMVAATRAENVKLMVAYRLHFEKANLTAIERIRKGEIGDPRIFTSTFCQQVREGDVRTRGRTAGGAAYDMGVHCINAARNLFREEPTQVLAVQVRDTGDRFQEVDEATTAILRFSSGRVAQFTASQGAADVAEYRVVGTKGDIRLDPAYGYRSALSEYVTVGEKTYHTSYSSRDQFAPELIHFSNAILTDTEPEPSGEEGLCDVRVLRAIEASARTGQRVNLAPYEREDDRPRPSLRLDMRLPAVGNVRPVDAPSPSK